MESLVCKECNNKFMAYSNDIKRGRKFCSLSCSSKFNKRKNNKPNVKCAFCKKVFYKMPSKQLASKSGLFFCCRKHKDISQRIGGIPEIMPPHYNTSNGLRLYRKRAFKHYENKCSECGYNKFIDILVVHHIDENRTNNKIENLKILCPNCHAIYHMKLE